ncbi:MAG: hypothetical protein EXR29_05650 [Betaproteobacteria bacterium]|nr:hypothetical protein [Betaproteobacteria bacterium]
MKLASTPAGRMVAARCVCNLIEWLSTLEAAIASINGNRANDGKPCDLGSSPSAMLPKAIQEQKASKTIAPAPTARGSQTADRTNPANSAPETTKVNRRIVIVDRLSVSFRSPAEFCRSKIFTIRMPPMACSPEKSARR